MAELFARAYAGDLPLTHPGNIYIYIYIYDIHFCASHITRLIQYQTVFIFNTNLNLILYPGISPTYAADLSGLPPLLIECGECEVLNHQINEIVKKLKTSKVDVDFNESPDMV